jgi:hypothetical protein
MANWESRNISDVVKEIDDKKYVLPVIQRRLVWEEEKMELLFDTLLKGDSFGGIMVIKEDRNTKPLFPFRPFTKDGEDIASAEVDTIPQSQNFVVDGQQRLQTFYIGLLGTMFGRLLYFDLFSNYNTKYEFEFESDVNKLEKQAKDDSPKIIKKRFWYCVNHLFDLLNRTNNDRIIAKKIIADYQVLNGDEKDTIEENIAAFFRNIFSGKSLGISEVTVDKEFDETTNRQKIVELFRRLNDGGTVLSPFELVASIFKGFDWRMEKFLDETIEEFKEIGLSQDNLIKLIFLLQDNHAKEMLDVSAADVKFAIEKRIRIKAALSSLKTFVYASDLFNYYKDSNRSFIPLFFVVYHIFHKQIDDEKVKLYFDNFDANNPDYVKIKKWLYYSLLNGVFRSKGAGWIPYKTGTRKILEEIKKFKNQDFPIDNLFGVYYDHGVIFTEEFDETNLDSLNSQFLYYLIYDRRQTIRIQDVDHIIPKSILQKLGFDGAKINSIKNFQLLDYGTNRGEKNASPFKEWINTLPDKPAFIRRHLIPLDENIWVEERFNDFTTARGQLILDKINKYVHGE